MVTDNQVRRLLKLAQTEKTKALASSKAGMDAKTARKYLRSGRLPSQVKKEHTWQTRKDPFADVWPEIEALLKEDGRFEATTLFAWLQREYPGRFSDGQLRTLQRKIKRWRALEGPFKEVYFQQKHSPGDLCASDFTHMNELEITIDGVLFKHMIYHFVLTYSNWETGTICFSESFESISEGLQNALWELGGVPVKHRTDRLSSAVHKVSNPEEFTQRYKGLLSHYRIKGEKIQAGKANENGDIEQRHYRFKKALEQALLLRGSRNFASRTAYSEFLRGLFTRLNSGRKERFQEELRVLRRLPERRLNDFKQKRVKVGPGSAIRLQHNVYSVPSRLKGEWVEARLYAEYVEIWYAQRMIERMPRLRGEEKHRINYRHIIDCLVRKPGAFENYRYRDDLFPSSRFRMAYDVLTQTIAHRANKEYVKILHYAASESEARVDDALRLLLEQHSAVSFDAVKALVDSSQKIPSVTEVSIDEVNLEAYDHLLSMKAVL
ncbi:MAG: IS21 family transposase [Deltaproteobacteria bacterium]|nr:IS21 family transposase [Deltaproteobacteria bacterium]